MPRTWIPAALGVATVVAALVFALAPGLDRDAAALFYAGGAHFAGDTPLGNALRKLFYWLPTAVLLLMLALYAARRFGRAVLWAPTGRGAVFLVLTFAVGPGLVANTILKEHSHRPRPYQTAGFGGDEPFRPFYSFDGACRRNCSFVSGEGATSAWTLGPALLVPPPWQGAAIAASLVFAVLSGTLRMAFGGHYFSDAVFAVLLSWWVLWLGWVLCAPRRRTAP
ncbi:MAG: phosphatase PAP2 family protein [Caulobacteraceae bacterium]|nr:phosphatase PAP2 family protein [Caulobacter sp.]